ncbi:tetratricopeptide repeat protein [Phycisphaerales bacterium]|nr:tetratricopeptide repeat protein [Phycisphaerales bacterium]
MIPTSYEPPPDRRASPASLRRKFFMAVVTMPLVLTGCDRPTPASGTPDSAPPMEISASDRDASLDAIDRWLAAGRADNAESIARMLATRLPNDPMVAATLGQVLLMRSAELREIAGEAAASAISAEAAEMFLAADQGGRRDAATLRSLGVAQERSGRLDAAIETYRRAADEDALTRLYLGLALLQAEKGEESVQLLTALSTARPDDAFVRAALAEARFRTGDTPGAFNELDEAVRLAPDEIGIRLRRASLLRRTGNARMAIESLVAIPDSERNQRMVVEELAAGWRSIQRPAAAAEVWASRARSVPADVPAALMAAACFAEADRPSDAEAWLRIAEETSPGDASVAAERRRLGL